MLALTALNLIVKGALAYYSMHKGKNLDIQVSDDSLSDSAELMRKRKNPSTRIIGIMKIVENKRIR